MSTYYERNKEKIKERSKLNYHENKESRQLSQKAWREKHQDKMRDYRKTWLHSNPEYVMYHNAKRRAKDANVAFSILPSDIIIPEKCPVLGITLVRGEGKSSDSSPSLDKINPQLGYVVNNIQVISSKANRLKNDATLEELKAIINYIENQQ